MPVAWFDATQYNAGQREQDISRSALHFHDQRPAISQGIYAGVSVGLRWSDPMTKVGWMGWEARHSLYNRQCANQTQHEKEQGKTGDWEDWTPWRRGSCQATNLALPAVTCCRFALALAASFVLRTRCCVLRGRVADLLVRGVESAHAHECIAACTCTDALLGAAQASLKNFLQNGPSILLDPSALPVCGPCSQWDSWMSKLLLGNIQARVRPINALQVYAW